MLTPDTIDAFIAHADTGKVVRALVESQILGTELGDQVLAIAQNHPARHRAIVAALRRRGLWDSAA